MVLNSRREIERWECMLSKVGISTRYFFLVILDFNGSWHTTLWCITATNWKGVWTGKRACVDRQTAADSQLYHEWNRVRVTEHGKYFAALRQRLTQNHSIEIISQCQMPSNLRRSRGNWRKPIKKEEPLVSCNKNKLCAYWILKA